MSRATRLPPAFVAIAVARTCVWTASSVSGVVLPVLLYTATGDAALTALLATIEVVPYLLVGLVAGAIADAASSRRWSMVCCAVCALASGIVAAAALVGLFSAVLLFAAALAAGLALVFFDATMFAALPRVVARDDLARAFSSMTAWATVITMAAPAASGAALLSFPPGVVLLADTALFCVAVAVFAAIRSAAFRTPPVAERSTERPSAAVGRIARARALGRDVAEGIRFVAHAPLIRTLTLLGIGNSFAEGVLVASLVPAMAAVGATLPFAASTGALTGAAQLAIALGALAGSVILPRLSGTRPTWAITCAGLVTGAAGLLGWSQLPLLPIALVALLTAQLGSTVVILNGITARASATPLALQSRVNMTARLCAWGGQPVGALVAAATIGVAGPRNTVLIAVAVVLATAALAAIVLRRADMDPRGLSPSPRQPSLRWPRSRKL